MCYAELHNNDGAKAPEPANRAASARVVSATPGVAVIGCLSEIDELVPRSTIILQGTILDVLQADVGECKPPVTVPCDEEFERTWREGLPEDLADAECVIFPEQYRRCGRVWRLVFQVDRELLGAVPPMIDVYVAPEWLGLHCDDRPEVPSMRSHRAFLFIEKRSGAYWTVDGPNSLYTYEPGRFVEVEKEDLGQIVSALTLRSGGLPNSRFCS